MHKLITLPAFALALSIFTFTEAGPAEADIEYGY